MMNILPKFVLAALLFLGAAHGLVIEPVGDVDTFEPTGHNETAFGGCTRVSDSFSVFIQVSPNTNAVSSGI